MDELVNYRELVHISNGRLEQSHNCIRKPALVEFQLLVNNLNTRFDIFPFFQCRIVFGTLLGPRPLIPDSEA